MTSSGWEKARGRATADSSSRRGRLFLCRGEHEREDAMRLFICVTAVFAVACAAFGANGAEPLSVYANASLGQNFMGGFDYLPDGDIIGMYVDPNMVSNSYIGIIDANGDGVPAVVNRVYEFGVPTYGIVVKVSPDGSRVLFGDSFSFKVYSMSLPDHTVTEIVPSGATFAGAYDIAFIDAGYCYLSANPGAFPATTNKIFRLDLASGGITELASVDGTYSGPIDVDTEGNLYYVRGKANFPPQPGDFSVLKFPAAKFQDARAGATVLGEADAEVIAAGLDGGQDVAWDPSGALWVSDANNGAVYTVSATGVVNTAAFIPGESAEGFWFLSVFGRNLPLGSAQLAANYQPLTGEAEPDLYLITPPYAAGQNLVVTAAITQTVPIPFDAYVVLAGAGALYSVTPTGLREGMVPYAAKVPSLAEGFSGIVLDMEIPTGASGVWTVYAGLMRAGESPSATGALALDTAELTVR